MKNKILIISPYPKKGTYSHRKSALASFSKNLVNSLKARFKIIILDDQNTWKKNDLFNYFNLLKTVLKHKDIKNILIQFEWTVFGNNIFFILMFPFFLLLLKLIGKNTYVVLHGVNFKFERIFGCNFKSYVLNIGSYIFYTLTCIFSKKVIVTENYFKKKLFQLPFCKNKVVYIPHGVDIKLGKKMKKNKKPIKIRLGYFGYLNPYKGPKELLDLFTSINQNSYSLTFYGGMSLNLKKHKDYLTYIKDLISQAKKNKIKITEFIKENKLNNYFNEVDLIIFPYRAFISSSGILAMTFSFEKPFILSRPLEGYFESPDFSQALKETGLKKEDFIFDFNKESFKKRLEWAKKNLNKLSQFSRIMKEKRIWENVARLYEKILNE